MGGLKAPQRSCRVIKDLHDGLYSMMEEDISQKGKGMPDLKHGVKLPNSGA